MFVGTPEQVISFDLLAPNARLSNQYADWGVNFENTGAGRYAAYSGRQSEGNAIAEDVTGYDGSYMPDGDPVYVKFDNHLEDSPFTILFDNPVALVAAFLGMGVQGTVHTLHISLFDQFGELLDEQTVQSWLWEESSQNQNYETFFAVRSDEADISRVEIRNVSTADFANALIMDNLAFGTKSVPEPACLVLFCSAGLLLLRQRYR
jgi:hypothetical protein